MKLTFKKSLLFALFFILFSVQLEAREIVLIENLATLSEGEVLKKILITKFHLPKELITLKHTNTACEARSEAVIHLCLQSDGELVIKKMNQYIVKNSLGVFLNQEESVGK